MTFNVGYHNAVDGWYEEVWFPQPFNTMEFAEECAFKALTERESVYCFFIREGGVGICKVYFRVPGASWEGMDVQGVA